jgi:LPS export ABC transporter protein LptC
MYKLSNFISFLLISTLFLSCETNRDEVLSIGKKTITPSQTGKNVDMLYSDSTILKIKLQAPQMLMYDKGVKEPLTILPKGVMVIFYDRNEKESTTLKGNYAIRYEKSQRMEIRYNVEVVNEKGEKLNTERLVWDEQKKKITSDAFVKITTAKEVITGNGLEANQDFTKYEIKNIIATIRLDDSSL